MKADEADIDINRASHWVIASAVVVFVCGVLAIVLPLTFSVGIAALLGWLFILAAAAHVIFGMHFEATHWGWHLGIAGLYILAGTNLLVNPLLGVLLLILLIGTVLILEGIIEIALFFVLRPHRPAIWILLDGILTFVIGIIACAHWPPDSLEVVQYVVGLSFIASGVSRLVLGFAIPLVDEQTRVASPGAATGAK